MLLPRGQCRASGDSAADPVLAQPDWASSTIQLLKTVSTCFGSFPGCPPSARFLEMTEDLCWTTDGT
ncbi:hypothetical protein Y1Q_0018113 [Alligator mississippiensis]|uniref:Uncharacterized protein n=1 Tax=Alligator mississippiensis TaxID=8496 RepID=A0A151N3F4_ALLMI|nr:hypothetical protein Y1Q_0018113 [Alligator mississippiensis]